MSAGQAAGGAGAGGGAGGGAATAEAMTTWGLGPQPDATPDSITPRPATISTASTTCRFLSALTGPLGCDAASLRVRSGELGRSDTFAI